MIITFTPNPSLDISLKAIKPLQRGAVQRTAQAKTIAGGKGINVSKTLARCGMRTKALFPSDPQDSFLRLLKLSHTPFEVIPTNQPVRVNTTIWEKDGTTTKLNGPGGFLSPDALASAADFLALRAPQAEWMVLAGSLPPGAPTDWYADLIELLVARKPGINIAVDTSDVPLKHLMARILHGSTPPRLLKPNAEELAVSTGCDIDFEQAAAAGDFDVIFDRIDALHEVGISEVLATLGCSGAVLSTPSVRLIAHPVDAPIASTVGAGDCSLAAYLGEWTTSHDYDKALRKAAAFGTAAASLPGTEIPSPKLADRFLPEVVVTRFAR